MPNFSAERAANDPAHIPTIVSAFVATQHVAQHATFLEAIIAAYEQTFFTAFHPTIFATIVLPD